MVMFGSVYARVSPIVYHVCRDLQTGDVSRKGHTTSKSIKKDNARIHTQTHARAHRKEGKGQEEQERENESKSKIEA